MWRFNVTSPPPSPTPIGKVSAHFRLLEEHGPPCTANNRSPLNATHSRNLARMNQPSPTTRATPSKQQLPLQPAPPPAPTTKRSPPDQGTNLAMQLHRLAVVIFSATTLAAQCDPFLIPYTLPPGVAGSAIDIVEWDPDGSGPASPVLALGGSFVAAGAIQTQNIASYDPATNIWSALGGGVNGHAWAIDDMPNGDLIVGGLFTSAGGVAASCVARWDGSTWHPLGPGLGGLVRDVIVVANGDIVAGGSFTVAGGAPSDYIAKWDGSNWSSMGAAFDGRVEALAVTPNGDLMASGCFTTSGSQTVNGIARWDGVNWQALSTGMNGCVGHLQVSSSGDLIAAGQFTSAGSQPVTNIAKWDGANWLPLGVGLLGSVTGIGLMPNSDLVASCTFFNGVSVDHSVSYWDGATWNVIAADYSARAFLPWPSGDLYTLNNGEFAPGIVNGSIARFDGSSWHPLGSGLVGRIHELHVLPNNDVIVGGWFGHTDAPSSPNIARFDGAWHPLGLGVDGLVSAIIHLPNGDIVAAGMFTQAGGVPASNVARWDGTTWNALGAGLTGPLNSLGPVRALVALPNGDIMAGGSITHSGTQPVDNVALWDGSTWTQVGAGLPLGCRDLALLSNGNIVTATSQFGFPSAALVWDGTAWQSPFGLFGDAQSVTATPDGSFIVAGNLSLLGVGQVSFAKTDGTTWQQAGSTVFGTIKTIATLPNGDIVAGGVFSLTSNGPTVHLARIDDTTSIPIGSFSGHGLTRIHALAMTDSSLVIGGEFHQVDQFITPAMASLIPACSGSVTSLGIGCTGSAGIGQLTGHIPWIGSNWTATAANLPVLSIAVQVYGLSALSVPLSTVLAQGTVGCNLLVSPDFITVALPVAGTAQSQLTFPQSTALIGQTFDHQVAPLEVDVTGTIIAATSTNVIRCVIGSF